MDGAGVPVQESKGEWGPGQAELNLVYAEALEMADRHVIFKNGAKEIAWAHGKSLSFMAKWRQDLAGSSCHIHASLWQKKGDKPLFADKGRHERAFQPCSELSGRPSGSRRRCDLALGPQRQQLQALRGRELRADQPCLEPGQPNGGLSRAGAWRRTARRMPRARRGRESLPRLCRAAGGGALRNRERTGAEGTRSRGDAYQSGQVPALPRTLHEACDRFERSEVMRRPWAAR